MCRIFLLKTENTDKKKKRKPKKVKTCIVFMNWMT